MQVTNYISSEICIISYLNDENDVSLSKRGITIDGKKNLLC